MIAPIPTKPTDPLPGPDLSTRDESHEIREAPVMEQTPETPIRDAVEGILSDVLSPEERAKLREELKDKINARYDIPYIGEKIEGIVIGLALRIVELLAVRIARKRLAPIIDKAEELLR